MSEKKITQTLLKKHLNYDHHTGVFTCITKRIGTGGVGSVVGSPNDGGYLLITILGRSYKAHRLAWLYIYGYLPELNIDHINRNTSDNRIINLREVSHVCNMRNSGNRKDNTSGVKGVSWHKDRRKWVVQINLNGQRHYLGICSNFCNAVCLRLAIEQCLDWDGCDSSSPAFQYVQKNILNR